MPFQLEIGGIVRGSGGILRRGWTENFGGWSGGGDGGVDCGWGLLCGCWVVVVVVFESRSNECRSRQKLEMILNQKNIQLIDRSNIKQ